MEVVIAEGRSADGTRAAIQRFVQAHPGLAVRIVDNALGTIPAGLNLAMAESRAEILVRLDAHSKPNEDYVERCVQAIEAGKGTSVGGVWNIQPGGPGTLAKAIAAAAAHPLGAGDAHYRLGGPARPVDTVPFGAFRRTLFEELKGFDETLLTNEDYEFNVRIRRLGGVIWMDPRIRSTYFARPVLRELARQYWRYGFWKFRMLARFPGSVRWRQVLPPAFIVTLVAAGLAALFWPFALLALLLILAIYVVALVAAGVEIGIRRRDARLIPGAALALATMHLSWGGGFLWSVMGNWLTRHG
jgi:hypothetical protein